MSNKHQKRCYNCFFAGVSFELKGEKHTFCQNPENRASYVAHLDGLKNIYDSCEKHQLVIVDKWLVGLIPTEYKHDKTQICAFVADKGFLWDTARTLLIDSAVKFKSHRTALTWINRTENKLSAYNQPKFTFYPLTYTEAQRLWQNENQK